MANMQKEGLKGECPYGFTQLSVRSQKMAVLLHRMKQLNELDHTEWSLRYCYDRKAWSETRAETEERYRMEKAVAKKAKEDYNSPEAAFWRDRYAAEMQRVRDSQGL
jgi:hypothetical protein